MRAVARADVVALEMQRYIVERRRVAVEIQRTDIAGILALVLGGLELAEEVLGEVRGSYGDKCQQEGEVYAPRRED